MAAKTKATSKKVFELESLSELTSEKNTAKKPCEEDTDTKEKQGQDMGARKVKILNVVCRPDGTYLAGKVYELPAKLADTLIKNGSAEELK